MSAPVLTVGISFYNTAGTLVDLARSMFAQTFADWELILLDDGSDDGGSDILQQIRDPRVRIIKDGCNRGRPARYNYISKVARGKYVARMDADDLCHPQRFSKQIAYLEARPDIDVVSSDYLALASRDRLVGRLSAPTEHKDICLRPTRGVALLHGGCIGRTAWFRDHPYPDYPMNEDLALFLSSHRQSRFASIPEPLYYYRVIDTFTLRKHFFGEIIVAQLIWRYNFRHAPLPVILRAMVGRYFRIGIYFIAEIVRLRKLVLARRFGPVDESARQEYERAISIIRTTRVPGLA